jgi:hypothetical protein
VCQPPADDGFTADGRMVARIVAATLRVRREPPAHRKSAAQLEANRPSGTTKAAMGPARNRCAEGGGRLLHARKYAYADRDKRVPWEPSSLCRVGSVSKSITAVAVMTLVQSGRLRLDEPAFPRLGLTPFVKPGTTVDPRLWSITVRQLLQHTVFPDDGAKLVPMSYGGAYYEAADSCGGWLASPVDLSRFITELQTARARALTPASYREMAAPPPPPVGKSGDAIQYGFGLYFQRRGDELCFFHGGNINGASTYLSSRFDGAAWAYMFNTNNEGETLANDLNGSIMDHADKVATGPGWPSRDLFGSFRA